MRYFRKFVDGGWKTVTLNETDITKIQEQVAIEAIKTDKRLNTFLKKLQEKKSIIVDDELKGMIWQKALPTFEDLASDFIEKNYAEKAAAATTS